MRDLSRWWGDDELFDFFERTAEAFQNAVKLDAHLKSQRVAGRIVGARRCSTRIRDVVGVILRLEHVKAMCTKRLAAVAASTILGVIVQLSRLPRSMAFLPMSQMLCNNSSRLRDA